MKPLTRIYCLAFVVFFLCSFVRNGTYNTAILFDFDKHFLKEESKSSLNEIIKLYKENSDCCIELSGHTDHIGSNEYNQALSERRVNTVKDYLMTQGVNEENILYSAHGELKPATKRTDDAGRQLNRRVEVKLKFTVAQSLTMQ